MQGWGFHQHDALVDQTAGDAMQIHGVPEGQGGQQIIPLHAKPGIVVPLLGLTVLKQCLQMLQ